MSEPFYPFYPGDYFRDTGDLTLEEHGAYHIMLHHLYSNEALPSDRERLYRLTRANTDSERRSVDNVADRFFKQNGNRLTNNRAEKERMRRSRFLSLQREKGIKSAIAREQKFGTSRPLFSSDSHEPNQFGSRTESNLVHENAHDENARNETTSREPNEPTHEPAHELPYPYPYPDLKTKGKRKKKNTLSGKPDDAIPFEQIIEYLNTKAGKNFNAKAESTRKHIRARHHEGATLEDFKRAIDNQCREWLSTEMEMFLRPSTLFNSEKFDGYVNNVRTKKEHAKKKVEIEERKQIDEALAKGREILERMKGEGECLTPSVPKFG